MWRGSNRCQVGDDQQLNAWTLLHKNVALWCLYIGSIDWHGHLAGMADWSSLWRQIIVTLTQWAAALNAADVVALMSSLWSDDTATAHLPYSTAQVDILFPVNGEVAWPGVQAWEWRRERAHAHRPLASNWQMSGYVTHGLVPAKLVECCQFESRSWRHWGH